MLPSVYARMHHTTPLIRRIVARKALHGVKAALLPYGAQLQTVDPHVARC